VAISIFHGVGCGLHSALPTTTCGVANCRWTDGYKLQLTCGETLLVCALIGAISAGMLWCTASNRCTAKQLTERFFQIAIRVGGLHRGQRCGRDGPSNFPAPKPWLAPRREPPAAALGSTALCARLHAGAASHPQCARRLLLVRARSAAGDIRTIECAVALLPGRHGELCACAGLAASMWPASGSAPLPGLALPVALWARQRAAQQGGCRCNTSGSAECCTFVAYSSVQSLPSSSPMDPAGAARGGASCFSAPLASATGAPVSARERSHCAHGPASTPLATHSAIFCRRGWVA
jgi:hypothetical protein